MKVVVGVQLWRHAMNFTAEVVLEGIAKAGSRGKCTPMGRASMSLDLQVTHTSSLCCGKCIRLKWTCPAQQKSQIVSSCGDSSAWLCRHCREDWLSWRAQVALRPLLTHCG